ncbi:hypothetical protein ONS96_001462 [Cadophora gregata f. sp. sojae]|nr:hypothetical protein ONS96_001462 [Cadophora gregata f. sp. sojae]
MQVLSMAFYLMYSSFGFAVAQACTFVFRSQFFASMIVTLVIPGSLQGGGQAQLTAYSFTMARARTPARPRRIYTQTWSWIAKYLSTKPQAITTNEQSQGQAPLDM